MPLLGPTDEDVRKIHAEINQLVNQRFLLTTVALTLFGAVLVWIARVSPSPSGEPPGVFPFHAAMVLLAVLFSIFLYSLLLSGTLRSYTAYLVVMEKSKWEVDWKVFRKNYSYLGYTKPQAIVFMVLGFVSALVPFLLVIPRAPALACSGSARFLIGFCCVYVVLVLVMGFCRSTRIDEKFEEKWKQVKNGNAH